MFQRDTIQRAVDSAAMGGGMPTSAPGATPASAPAAASDPGADGDVLDDDLPEGEDDGQEPAPAAPPAAPQAGAGPGEQGGGLPHTPTMQKLGEAAGQLIQVRDHISQRYPVVTAQRQALESVLRSVNYDLLTPEQQAAATQQYQTWQHLAAEEQQLTTKWREYEEALPMLQQAVSLEEQRALLNRVGAPMAHDLLAQKYAKAAGTGQEYPAADMREYLANFPPGQLEAAADQFDKLWRKWSGTRRRAERVDAMGPGGGGGGNWAKSSSSDLIRSALADELRRSPPR